MNFTNHNKTKQDFSFQAYKHLIQNLMNSGFYFFNPINQKIDDCYNGIIIRHDVDRKPLKALQMATIEKELGVKSIYFFRVTPGVFKPEIMKLIADMGHEIGYHYENLSEVYTVTCDSLLVTGGWKINENAKMRKCENARISSIQNSKIKIQNYDLNQSPVTSHQSRILQNGLNDFILNLKSFRTICKIRFIAAHGSPRSSFDNRDLWKYFDYKELGIESDFSIIKDEMLYITDAGRSWNNLKVNRRDVSNIENFPDVKSIFEIPEVIQASGANIVMLNIHPEHWASSKAEWVYIYLYRKVRNALKRIYLAANSLRKLTAHQDKTNKTN